MKEIIFAGGAGTRLWPLSRKNSPKQFGNVIGNKSTLQMAAERLLPDIPWENIYVSTCDQYVHYISKQLPLLPLTNIIGEPEMRDVGPAVGLVLATLMSEDKDASIIILWSDHIVKQTAIFKRIIKCSEELIKGKKDRIIFIGQKPRYASQNLGWINFGPHIIKKDGINFSRFDGFVYRPSLSEAADFYQSKKYAWNVGYFVTTPGFLWQLFEKYQPELFSELSKIQKAVGTPEYLPTLKKIYPTLPKISFDNAILENITAKNSLVVCEDLGWSDVGAWEALKEALQKSPDQNVIQGKVLVTDCKDTLVYNYTDQLVVTIDLEGLLVVNTNDVSLICHKNSVPKIKQLVEKLAATENGKLV
jgi:mannose-1-phosphate guanylyltransferase